ncbi:GntR family transcriptional regulator [Mesorhizobium sp. WSM4887]|uniref:GntR family transcriptional regulator n=1 Tax=Mesorhizobium sp. WSM4887 TaxID=3038543 RepID=UPI002417706F|nr:GntR family transcriptional regulator [Mesorhizobium sp. WSM4887]MDG4889739.1 GntR family transcriptional regulator [Mesorhizobium sp. WSM4887]
MSSKAGTAGRTAETAVAKPGAGVAPALGRRSKAKFSLTEKAYNKLRADIFDWTLEPGSEVSESELASRLKMSKTPVREALAKLRSEGFVQTFPRRGYLIVPITFGDMQELFDIRLILETGSAELACSRITDDQIDRLYVLAAASYNFKEQPTIQNFLRSNREFHGAIAAATGSERLQRLLLQHIDALERFFYLGARYRDIGAETSSEHEQIVDLLKKRDPVKVREAIVDHITRTRDNLYTILTKTSATTRIRIQF